MTQTGTRHRSIHEAKDAFGPASGEDNDALMMEKPDRHSNLQRCDSVTGGFGQDRATGACKAEQVEFKGLEYGGKDGRGGMHLSMAGRDKKSLSSLGVAV